MSSSDNHIYEEIKSLLSKDISAEKVEKLLTLLDSHRPGVDIDRGFQVNLKKSLLTQKKSPKASSLFTFSLFQKISLLSAVYASFLMVFTFWKLLFSHPDISDREGILSQRIVPETLLQSESTKEKVSPNAGANRETFQKQIKTDAVDQEIQAIMGDLSDLSLVTPSQKQSAKTNDTSSVSENTPAARSAIPVSAFSMSAPMVASADIGVPLDSQETDIQSEISSIVSDMNNIVSSASTNSTIVLPDYPEQIAVYQKSGTFTDDEILTQRGQNIVTVLMHTEQDTSILLDELKKKAGGKRIKGPGKLVYEVLVKNEITSFLVPKIQFSLVSGKTISVSVVSGVE